MKEINHKYIAQLVKLAQQNSSDAFAELYAITYNKTYNYACYYLKDSYLAQDAVQEIYIRALKNILKIQDPTLFSAWLNQIAFRVCYDMSEKKHSHALPTDSEILEFITDEHPRSNPERDIQQKAEYEQLRLAIDALPFHERQVIIMKYYNDMKLEAIANAMDVSRSSIKRYLSAGLKSLKKIMKD